MFSAVGGGIYPLLDALQITFRDMEIYLISRGARSLIIMKNVSEMACLTLDIIVLLFGGNHKILSSLSQICIRNCFGGSKCTGTRGHPHMVASLPHSFPRGSLSETWKYTSRSIMRTRRGEALCPSHPPPPPPSNKKMPMLEFGENRAEFGHSWGIIRANIKKVKTKHNNTQHYAPCHK